jgi:hypothetical protein
VSISAEDRKGLIKAAAFFGAAILVIVLLKMLLGY